MHIEEAALFRKTDWESGRVVLPCWKAESAPPATTKPLFSAEACSAYQYSRSAWFFQTVVQKSLTEYFLNRIHACAHLILYEKFNRKILCNCITRPPLYSTCTVSYPPVSTLKVQLQGGQLRILLLVRFQCLKKRKNTLTMRRCSDSDC